MNSLKIDPKIDFVFRKLFGSDENKDLLMSLINSVVEPELRLTDVTIKNPYNLASYKRLKQSILDIKAKDQDGIWYDLEIQLCHHSFYGKRALFYLTKLYTDQLPKGENYSILNIAIGIHFLDFDLFKDDRMLHQFVFKDTITNDRSGDIDHLRLYFVEMRKFRKEWPEVSSALDRWVGFLNKAGELNKDVLPKSLSQEPSIIKAVEQLEHINLDPKERAIYEGEEKKVMIGKLEIESAKVIAMQEGHAEGLTVGRAEGRTEGRTEGQAEGMIDILSTIIEQKLGKTSRTVNDRIKHLSVEKLKDLSIALLNFHTNSELENWLNSQ